MHAGPMRPTTSRVRSALFNILTSSGEIFGARFLELFAGTGEISLEALKRGADSVVAVESDRSTAAEIKRRLAASAKPARVMTGDVRQIVPRIARRGETFDVIFADPPYGSEWSTELPRIITASAAIVGSCFVLERSRRDDPADIDGFARVDREYGETVLSFYRRDDTNAIDTEV